MNASRSQVSFCALLPLAVLAAVMSPFAALAEPMTVEGVSFEPPKSMLPQPVPPGSGPLTKSWKDSADLFSLTVAIIPGGGPDLARELEDWPSVGRSFINGFGESNAKALGQAYGAKCSFTGSPLMRDMSRMMMGSEAVTTCQTLPQPTVLKSRVVLVATKSEAGDVQGRLATRWRRGGREAHS